MKLVIVLFSCHVINLYNIANYLLGKYLLSEARSEPCQTSKMELFATMIGYQLFGFNYFCTKLHLNCLIGVECASNYVPSNYTKSERHS